MATFRLINLSTGVVTEQVLGTAPPYLAASHAWSEQRFPLGRRFLESPGRQALKAVNEQRFAGTVDYCWVDTICINQQDDADMNQQIPLMGRIFGDSIAVVIVLSCDLQMSQASVDRIVEQLKPAVRMHEEEEWAEQGAIWTTGHGRKMIIKGMRELTILQA